MLSLPVLVPVAPKASILPSQRNMNTYTMESLLCSTYNINKPSRFSLIGIYVLSSLDVAPRVCRHHPMGVRGNIPI